MPELPEVRTVVKYLNTVVDNKTISKASFYYNRLLKNMPMAEFCKIMVGQTIKDVFPRGKYIIFELSNYDMISHLRMEGKWVYEPVSSFIYGQKTMELQFEFENDSNVLRYYDFRRFGTLDVTPKDKWMDLPAIAKLGPEPWDKDMSAEYLYSKFQKTRSPIKTVLLDQTIILGIGNIYANEILFAAKINPKQPADSLTLKDCENILKCTQNILTKAIENGGTTIHSFAYGPKNAGNYQSMLMVHGRAGKKCKICGSTIEKIMVNGRGTYFCPSCQKFRNS